MEIPTWITVGVPTASVLAGAVSSWAAAKTQISFLKEENKEMKKRINTLENEQKNDGQTMAAIQSDVAVLKAGNETINKSLDRIEKTLDKMANGR